jgi:flavin reductase (DIM6/NTAB) family NADH-FMN oxidoreductase RutF
MDTLFDSIAPGELNENFFNLIKNDWMLVTAGTMGNFNTMTASWGTMGILWNKPIAICFIRPHRYTYEFTEKYECFTLSFFNYQYREVLDFCGTHSGRDIDKVSQTGLRPIETDLGNITFEQSRLVLECRKIYADTLKPENFLLMEVANKNYPAKDFHKFYIGEIVGCYVKGTRDEGPGTRD